MQQDTGVVSKNHTVTGFGTVIIKTVAPIFTDFIMVNLKQLCNKKLYWVGALAKIEFVQKGYALLLQ